VFPVIQNRIERYSRSEIRFNLMAIIKDRKTVFSEEIAKLQKAREGVVSLLQAAQGQRERTDSAMDVDSDSSPSLEDLKQKIQAIDESIKDNQHKVAVEEEKLKNWKVENIRRRHNYIPFFVNLLKILAEKGQLSTLIQSLKS